MTNRVKLPKTFLAVNLSDAFTFQEKERQNSDADCLEKDPGGNETETETEGLEMKALGSSRSSPTKVDPRGDDTEVSTINDEQQPSPPPPVATVSNAADLPPVANTAGTMDPELEGTKDAGTTTTTTTTTVDPDTTKTG